MSTYLNPQSGAKDAAVAQLMTADQSTLLDVIDDLRAVGISKEIPLPQIICCGDQSSGKSSVLEAISRISFPRGQGLCTTFPTELVLRRGESSSNSVRIKPAESRSKDAKKRLRGFRPSTETNIDVGVTIKDAKRALDQEDMGSRNRFFEDTLCVEVFNPDWPSLTLVDLPGVIQVANVGQPDEDVATVHKMVERYMTQEKSIILAVCTAENDAANQRILKLIKKYDPKGERTIGVVTKPDMANEREESWITYAKNNLSQFKYGWYALKNRGFSSGNLTLDQRDQEEDDFFKESNWRRLDSDRRGVTALRNRLSKILEGEVRNAIPELKATVQTKLKDCELQLSKMGEPRDTLLAQKLYLNDISGKFKRIVENALEGRYFTDLEFFRPNETCTEPYRLRKVLNQLNQKFSDKMADWGHLRRPVRDEHVNTEANVELAATLRSRGQELISRTEYLSLIRERVDNNQGTELPDTLPDIKDIVANLFREQSTPWRQIASDHLEEVYEKVCRHLNLVAEAVAGRDAQTMANLQTYVIEPAMKERYTALQTKFEEVIRPYERCHPITYNSIYTENRKKIKEQQERAYIDAIVEARRRKEQGLSEQDSTEGPNNLEILYSPILNTMEVYFSVAMRTFVDNIAVLAIELGLVDGLETIFTPSTVLLSDEHMLKLLSSESPAHQKEREELTKKKDELSEALHILQFPAEARLAKSKPPLEVEVLPHSPPSLTATALNTPSPRAPRTPKHNSGRSNSADEAIFPSPSRETKPFSQGLHYSVNSSGRYLQPFNSSVHIRSRSEGEIDEGFSG